MSVTAAAATPFNFFDASPGQVLLALGALGMYIASRAAADAVAGQDPQRPGLRALGHCMPIAMLALLCLHPSLSQANATEPHIGRPQLAVGLVFSATVACLTMALGVVTYLAPLAALPASRRVWPFVMPAALLALVAGFNGRLNWLHALMLLALGAAILNVWYDPVASVAGNSEPSESDGANVSDKPRRTGWVQLVLAIALAGVAGWAMARGATKLEQTSRLLTGVVLAGTVLGPLLALPVLGNVSRIAERGHAGSAVTTLVAMALLNLCVILPLVILAYHVSVAMSPQALAAAGNESLAATLPSRSAPYPMVSWRVDTVILVVIGFAMIPWAIGRWTISRAESLALIFAYAVYLALVAILSTRGH